MSVTSGRVILGCAPSAGLYHQPVSTDTVVEMLCVAVEEFGVCVVDTAPWYGCGKSELDIGTALRSERLRRALLDRNLGALDVVTKVGRVVCTRDGKVEGANDELCYLVRSDRLAAALQQDTCYAPNERAQDVVCVHDCTAKGVAASFAQSKKRLGVAGGAEAPARITTLRLHDADTEELFAESIGSDGGVAELCRLRDEHGAISGVSLGMNDPAFLLRFLTAHPPRTFDNVMMAGCWNLIDQSGAAVLAWCAASNIAVHNAGVFGAGLLWGASHYRYTTASAEVLQRRDRWAALAQRLGTTLPALAVGFALLPPAVSHVALGCATASELRGCMGACSAAPSRPMMLQIVRDACGEGLLQLDVIRQVIPEL